MFVLPKEPLIISHCCRVRENSRGRASLGWGECWVRRVFPIWNTPTRSGGPVASCFLAEDGRGGAVAGVAGGGGTALSAGPAGAVVRRSGWPRCCGSTFFSNGLPCRTARWRTGSTTSRACAGLPVFPMSRRGTSRRDHDPQLSPLAGATRFDDAPARGVNGLLKARGCWCRKGRW